MLGLPSLECMILFLHLTRESKWPYGEQTVTNIREINGSIPST